MGSSAGTLEQTMEAELQRKSHLCILFLGITRPQYQFPHSCVCVTVGDLYIPRIGPHIWLQQNRQPFLEIYKSLTDMNVGIGRKNIKWEPDSYL
jgi:hypothetical protein